MLHKHNEAGSLRNSLPFVSTLAMAAVFFLLCYDSFERPHSLLLSSDPAQVASSKIQVSRSRLADSKASHAKGASRKSLPKASTKKKAAEVTLSKTSAKEAGLSKPSAGKAPVVYSLTGQGTLRFEEHSKGGQAGPSEVLMESAPSASGHVTLAPVSEAFLLRHFFFGEGFLPLDINKAPIDKLLQLPGIGQPQAQAIDDFRQKTSDDPPFSQSSTLITEVGLPASLVDALVPLLTFEGHEEDADDGDLPPLVLGESQPLAINTLDHPSAREWSTPMIDAAISVVLRFVDFSLPVDQPLAIYNQDGQLVALYGGDLQNFFTPPIDGGQLRLVWQAPPTEAATGGFRLIEMLPFIEK